VIISVFVIEFLSAVELSLNIKHGSHRFPDSFLQLGRREDTVRKLVSFVAGQFLVRSSANLWFPNSSSSSR
jgi:hypothetical protein